MAITVQIEKHPLEDFSPSKYCEWCVTVTTDDPEGFTSADGASVPLQWALDFPSDTDILDPEEAKKIKGAPKYTIDPEPGKGTITQPGQKDFKICFVAACKDREGTEMSLENRVDYPPGAVLAPRDWHRVPFDGGPNGIGKIVGPAPVAMSIPSFKDEIAVLANFEAQKIASLVGVSIRPPQVQPLPVSARRVYVSGGGVGKP